MICPDKIKITTDDLYEVTVKYTCTDVGKEFQIVIFYFDKYGNPLIFEHNNYDYYVGIASDVLTASASKTETLRGHFPICHPGSEIVALTCSLHILATPFKMGEYGIYHRIAIEHNGLFWVSGFRVQDLSDTLTKANAYGGDSCKDVVEFELLPCQS